MNVRRSVLWPCNLGIRPPPLYLRARRGELPGLGDSVGTWDTIREDIVPITLRPHHLGGFTGGPLRLRLDVHVLYPGDQIRSIDEPVGELGMSIREFLRQLEKDKWPGWPWDAARKAMSETPTTAPTEGNKHEN